MKLRYSLNGLYAYFYHSKITCSPSQGIVLKIRPLRAFINQIITYKISNIFDVFPKKTAHIMIDVHAY